MPQRLKHHNGPCCLSDAAKLETTAMCFHYFPFHHLPLAGCSDDLRTVQLLLLACSIGCALGVAAPVVRACLAAAAAVVLYVMQLDRTVYNNHYVLLVELCALVACLDRRALCGPWGGADATAPLWNLRAVQASPAVRSLSPPLAPASD